MYLVIKTGYEGIEDLYWLTSDSNEAIRKMKELQIKEVKELIDMADVFENEEGATIEEITDEMIQHTKDFICIQKWDGNKFYCACSELGVKPSKMMLR